MPRVATKKKPIAKVDGFHFDKEAHAYTLDGKPLHGVTTILKVINKPALVQWAANVAVDHIEHNSSLVVFEPIEMNTRPVLKDIAGKMVVSLETLKEARIAHRIKKETAGEAGTDAHEMIEALVKNAIQKHDGFVTIEESGLNKQVDAFIKWAKENNICFLESEKRLYSKEHWYAGTCDLVFYDKDGVKWIGDVKTGSAIYPEYYFQMAAYQNALNEMGEHKDIKGAMVINTKKNGGIEIGTNYDYEGNLNAFLAALTIHKQLQALNPKQ